VRFETADTPPGPVRTFALDDPALHLAPPVWAAHEHDEATPWPEHPDL
jgi:hypothetical protein